MANLREIRDRITSIRSTQQITRAMKMVAAAKLRKAQNRIIATRPYANKLDEVIGRLVKGIEITNKYMTPNQNPDKVLFIVIGSDRGLCGGFNNNLFKVAVTRLHDEFQQYLDNDSLSMICIGRKANNYFKKRNYKVLGDHSGFFDDLSFENTTTIMKEVIAGFESDEYQAVYLVYNEFKSVLSQNRKVEQMLPIPSLDNKEEVEESTSKDKVVDYIFEPNAVNILKHLIPLHLNTQLWKAVLESNASEQGARMAAMDNATENAQELLRELRLKYNQARQASITTEISEIVSGAEALSD
ncbi:MAG TPA: ATP synthase F1 subunit gamma [Balneolales bacterium]|nr:ATP synthase F1 subunit gamma [Balneolales bacterium]